MKDIFISPDGNLNLLPLEVLNLIVNRSAGFSELSFEPLYHARADLEAIGDIMAPDKCKIFTGSSALEEILLSRQSPEILHLAIHGFFLSDQKAPNSGRGWEIETVPTFIFQLASKRTFYPF